MNYFATGKEGSDRQTGGGSCGKHLASHVGQSASTGVRRVATVGLHSPGSLAVAGKDLALVSLVARNSGSMFKGTWLKLLGWRARQPLSNSMWEAGFV